MRLDYDIITKSFWLIGILPYSSYINRLVNVPLDFAGWYLYRRELIRREEQEWQDTLSFHSMDILGIY